MASSDERRLQGLSMVGQKLQFQYRFQYEDENEDLNFIETSEVTIDGVQAATQFLNTYTTRTRPTVCLIRFKPGQESHSDIQDLLYHLSQEMYVFEWGLKIITSANSSQREGNLEGSFGSGRILVESPQCDIGPRLFFLLEDPKCTSDLTARNSLYGICMLDEDGLSDCIDKHFQLDFHFLHFDAIATSMVCSLLLVDIRWSWEKAKGIHDQVTSVELKMTEAGSDKSNDLITILNVCGQQIKQWDLECRRYFHRKAIVWLDKLLEEKPRKVSAYQLLEFDRYDQLGDPHTLQERIASVRALIDEDIVKNQQEQNVYLQRRIVEQQEKMQMIQEPSLRLTERLAEEADRDRLATRAREEANAKLTELSASIARQSLELARETRRDSRTMRGIGWVTMGFLPATFVASCFGMNFFNVTKEKPYFDESVKSVWIFFVFALPISAMVLWQFYRWDAKSERDALAREESQKEGNLVVRDSP